MMYGLASILRVNPEEMKSEVVAVLRDVLKWIVKLAGEIVEKREDLEFESESEEDDGVCFLMGYWLLFFFRKRSC